MNLLNNSKTPLVLLGVILLLSLLSTCNSCSNSKKLSRLKAEVDSLQTQLNERPTKKQLETALKIEGLRSSKRTLYDWNAVIRTTVRPDDQMNAYDQEIKALDQ